MNKISIIVPVYNSEQFLDRCISSILNQTYSNFELILVNDGSRDKSLEICIKYKSIDNRIILIDDSNHGPSYARNKGINSATGNYLFFVDSDDYIQNNCLELIVKEITKTKADICICSYNMVRENEIVPIEIFANNNLDFLELLYNKRTNVKGYPWGKLVKKDCIKVLFNEDICIKEDEIFWLDNSKFIKKCCYIKIPLYNYVYNENSLLNSIVLTNKKITVLDASLYIIDNNFYDRVNFDEIYQFLIHYVIFLAIGNTIQIKMLKQKYKLKFNELYVLYMNGNFKILNKAKIIFIKYFPFAYRILKKIQLNFHNK